MPGVQFNPSKDIPDLSGKVIFITGGTGGLGKECVITLAKHHPEHIYFSGRNLQSADAVIAEVKAAVADANVTFIECDLSSLASVDKAAKRFASLSQRLDVLMCNAGVMALPPGLTSDGYEVQFGTNHLGHALLTKLLLATLLRTAEEPGSNVHVVFLTSAGFRGAPKDGIIFKDLHTTQDNLVAGMWLRYGQSKLANILYAAELARRYPSLTSVSVHPGVIATDLVGKLSFLNRMLVYVTNLGSMKTLAEGTRNQLWAATSQKADIVSGTYYEPVGVLGKHTKYSNDSNLAAELWEWTEKELSGY